MSDVVQIAEHPSVEHRTYFGDVVPDTPADVLAEVEKCLRHLNVSAGAMVLMRLPLTIERDIDYPLGRKIARVYCRMSILK